MKRMDFELSKTVSTVLKRHLEPNIPQLEDWSDLYTKNVYKKMFFLKNRPIFSISLSIWHQPFQRSKHDVWALYWLYFPWYHTLPSLLYLHVFTPLWICKPQEKSRLVQNSLKYLSDHLSNVLKWKYASSAF